jgi:hemerythrin
MPKAEVLQRISGEHEQLKLLLDAVAGICPDPAGKVNCKSCADDVVHACECMLHEHLGEMLVFMTGHFRFEDSVMRDWQLLPKARETCECHQRDHSRISAVASRMVADLEQGNPIQGIRDLHGLLANWIERHIEVHDQEMIRLLQGSASA